MMVGSLSYPVQLRCKCKHFGSPTGDNERHPEYERALLARAKESNVSPYKSSPGRMTLLEYARARFLERWKSFAQD